MLDLTQFVSLQVTVDSTSSSGVSYDVIDRSLSVSSSWSGSTLTIDVNSGRTGAALEVIQLEVAGSVLAGEPPSSIKVAVNGTAVPLAPSITSLLSTGAGSPSYMISSAAAVYQLLIAIPRASRNTLSMGFPAGSTFLSEFTGLFIVVAAGVALMAALVYLRSRAASRRLGKRIILENN